MENSFYLPKPRSGNPFGSLIEKHKQQKIYAGLHKPNGGGKTEIPVKNPPFVGES
jgi:hypothetical protein